MKTKLKGDIAEQMVILELLKREWNVSVPIGDRLSYDLIVDINGKLAKLQVKSAWFDQSKNNYVVDNRRTQTNLRELKRSNYDSTSFDFAILVIVELNIYYVMPVNDFISYGSEIHLIETDKRQRKPKSSEFREAWNLILQWAAKEEIL